MNRNIGKHFSHLFLFAATVLIAVSQNIQAVDVCSPVSIGGQYMAEAQCGGCCEGCQFKCSDLAQKMGVTLPTTVPSTCGTPGNWNGNWLMDSDTLKCGGGNDKHSVCGCAVSPTCGCENGNQIACLEPKSCWTDCGCPNGTVCSAQWKCVKGGDKTCCDHCRNITVGCNAECVLLSGPPKTLCSNVCLEQWKSCTGNCGGWCNY